MTLDPVNVAFGEVLKSIREAGGLSPEEFAAHIGMEPKFYADIECAEWGATVSSLVRMAKAMGCTPEELIAATRERMSQPFRKAFSQLAELGRGNIDIQS